MFLCACSLIICVGKVYSFCLVGGVELTGAAERLASLSMHEFSIYPHRLRCTLGLWVYNPTVLSRTPVIDLGHPRHQPLH